MDAQRFDQLARAMAIGSSRRRLLRFVGGGVFGTVFAARQSVAEAAVSCNGETCLFGEICCAQGCTSSTGDECGCNAVACGECQRCNGTHCVAVLNGSTCSDDGNPCTDDVCASGTCTHPAKADSTACGDGQVCIGGTCCSTGTCCPSGTTLCGTNCVNLRTDESNCGACGAACAPGKKCCNGQCLDTGRDEHNCGRCGHRCRRHEVCRRGRCR
jgi:hypothetical protein